MRLALLITVCTCLLYCAKTADVKIRPEIAKYKDVADRMIQYVLHGPGQNETYNRLAYLTDTFGHRAVGSAALDKAIDFTIQDMTSEGFDNVHGEASTNYTFWKRGTEYANLILPRYQAMSVLGLGTSIPTPPGGVTADVLVVTSFAELKQQASLNKTQGKIIVYNQKWVSYGVSVRYRSRGASEAAKVGAVAALVRSVTPRSIYSPHTGMQTYQEGVKKIPTACITVEDAEMLHRMSQRGETIRIHFFMNSTNMPAVTSRNTVAEITGSRFPDQKVVIGGHMDSWDVGTGAMDDGGGVIISWQALRIMKALKLKPKRTVRAVFWTAEETGLEGATEYYFKNQETGLEGATEYYFKNQGEAGNFSLIMESDMGTFTPYGIGFSGNAAATQIMTEILQHLKSINASSLVPGGGAPDTGLWLAEGVPGGNLRNYNERYFEYHHSKGDTMSMMDRRALDLCTIVWTFVTYVVADLDSMLPRADDPATTVTANAANPIMLNTKLGFIAIFIYLYTRMGYH